jgi:hypothetical protein
LVKVIKGCSKYFFCFLLFIIKPIYRNRYTWVHVLPSFIHGAQLVFPSSLLQLLKWDHFVKFSIVRCHPITNSFSFWYQLIETTWFILCWSKIPYHQLTSSICIKFIIHNFFCPLPMLITKAELIHACTLP